MRVFSFRVTLSPMQIFAHRGVAGRNADENSIEAVRRAVTQGVDCIEVDVRRVQDLTVKELQDVVLRHGSKIATLDELTANVPPPIELDLEVKDREALDLMVRKLRTSTGLRELALLSSFSQDVIEQASHDVPDVRRLFLMRTWPVRIRFFMGWVKEHGLYGIGLSSRFWTDRRLQKVH